MDEPTVTTPTTDVPAMPVEEPVTPAGDAPVVPPAPAGQWTPPVEPAGDAVPAVDPNAPVAPTTDEPAAA